MGGLAAWTFVAVAATQARLVPVNPTCREPDQYGYCTDDTMYLELSRERPVVTAYIRVGVGEVFSMHFPAGVQIAKEGIEEGTSDVFYISEFKDRKISVKVIIPKKAHEMAKEALTDKKRKRMVSPADFVLDTPGNLHIRTRRGFLLDVKMRVGRPEKSVGRWLITSQELAEENAICEESFKKERDEAKAEIEGERVKLIVDRGNVARSETSFALMDVGRCRTWRRVVMTDRVRLEVERVCQVGKNMYAIISIRNRGRRSKVRIASIQVTSSKDDEWEPSDQQTEFRRLQPDGEYARFGLDDVELDFDQYVEGSVSWLEQNTPKSFSVVLTERGGMQRTVSIGGLSL